MSEEDNYIDLTRDGEQIEKMTERLLAGVPGETQEHAHFVATELVGAINEIHHLHRECLSEDGCYVKKNWFVRNIDMLVGKIAVKYGIKEEQLYGPLIHALNQQQTSAIRELVKGETEQDGQALVVEDVPIPEGWLPENGAEKDLAKETISSLAESLPAYQAGAACEGVLREANAQDELISEEEKILVQKALVSDRLSAEETALKQRVAVDTYITLRNDKEFAGSPLAGAIQTAITSVEQMKRLYTLQKIWQNAFDEAISSASSKEISPEATNEIGETAADKAVENESGKWDGYCKAGFVATVVTVLRRGLLGDAVEWLGKNVLSIPVNIVTSPIAEILFLFGIDLYSFNRKACGWIARYAICKPLATLAEKVYPVVKRAAVYAAQTTVEVAKKLVEVGSKVAKGTVSGAKAIAKVACEGIKATCSVVKKVATVVAKGAKKTVEVGGKVLKTIGGVVVAGANKAFDAIRDHGDKIFTRILRF